MVYLSVDQLPSKEVVPGMHVKSVHLSNVMMTFMEFDPDSEIPAHRHPHEQITFITHGRLEMTVGDETKTLKGGDIVLVPSEVEHSATVLEGGTKAVDAWHPVREDYILT